jgi:protease-4
MTEAELNKNVSDELLRDLLRERKSDRRWRLIRRVFMSVAGVMLFSLYLYFYAKQMGWSLIPNSQITAVIHIDGEISSGSTASAEKVIPLLRKAFEKPNVKAVILSIDSPGGAPVEAERIYQAIAIFKKKNPKPVVAVINNIGASAAYMIAMHTDKIYAANYSLVGSVGAVLAGWDFHKALEKLQVSQRVYASGALKSMLNPYIPMSPEADKKAQEMVELMGASFKADVVATRGKKLLNNFDYTTGEVWEGAQAKQIGLVDEIGTLDSVTAAWDRPVYDFGPKAPSMGWLSGMASAFQWLDRGLDGLQGSAAGMAWRSY